MATITQPNLFCWKEIDAASDLDRLILVLSVLPDEELARTLEKKRGRGRNDYPIRPTWNALIAGIIYQHSTAASLLREMKRNSELRDICGFDPFLGSDAVPSDDAFSNFLSLVMEHQELVLKMFHTLIDEVHKKLPDLGNKLAIDSKAIPSFGKPVTDEEKKNKTDNRRDLDADWGKKVYKGVGKDGKKWEKVTSWFGFKLHLLVDSVYELPLSFSIKQASSSDQVNLIPLIEDTNEHHSEIIKQAKEASADRGYDSSDNNRILYDEYNIKPVIDKRKMWKDPDKTKPLYPEGIDSFTYNEHGLVQCVCPKTNEIRDLYFDGFDKERESLKYRCPAAAYELDCKGRKECEGRTLCPTGDYGRVIRVPLENDRRIFTPIARTSSKWKKAYNRRTSVERVNGRIDQVLGFEKHNIRGIKKMETRMTLALIVMLAMALGRIKANQKDVLRSLTAPVKRAA